ncbi:MAG: hypothetical protein COB53_02935 [Elusimicrobia bacterium]|nr:MAG: hypothetical protein COB53_02935 [Elusimicrobiota bacterium]
MKIKSLFTMIVFLGLVLPAAATDSPLRDNDNFSIAEPAEDESGDYIWSDGAYFMAIYQMEKPLDLGWVFRKLHILKKREAENITQKDDVLNSTWFTHRHARQQMSHADLARGPGQGNPPTGRWTVIKGKSLGINPGFVAIDEQGRRLFVKFDPPEFPGMGINGDVIASRMLHAAGFNVPEYYHVWLDPKDLILNPKANIRGKYRKKRVMTQNDLELILSKAPRNEQGLLLANVSVGLEGKPKGPFNYLGVRKDDPNDTVRHENRRELRGLRVIMSWINNTDSRRGNSLDMYVAQDGRRYLKHYLIDFSASFGSGNIHPKEAQESHEYFFDPGTVTRSFGALGLWVKPWEKEHPRIYPEIGRFEATTFNPAKWRTSYANPAFEKMTARDAQWGARIVNSFSNEDIRTLVNTGYFPTPGAKEYLIATLIERRNKIGEVWLNQIRPRPWIAQRVHTGPDTSPGVSSF